ncbi:MAG: metallophosphoesterase [Chitinophagales bacterium]|nr:metallophosphoesterase [Chitinophagales bacterium]MDW8273282.1 metallophosphoesterase [Chitinophagales bacterium]
MMFYSVYPQQYSGDTNNTSFSASLVQPNSLVFFVIGDWGRKGKYFQKDVAAAMNHCASIVKPAFIVSTGDNFYTFGVRGVNDKHWKKSFENVYNGKYISDVPWYVCLGNHDYYGKEASQIEYSKINKRWILPDYFFAVKNYTPDSAAVAMLFLNTQIMLKDFSSSQRQLTWADSILKNDYARWKLVFGHHPVYSSNPMHGDNHVLIEKLKPVLESNFVHAYFSGHDHDLQHQKPEGSITEYFISGAGSKIRPSYINENTKFAISKAGFAIVAVNKNTLQLWFVDKDAKILYSFSIK